jgi:quercetin dioxygenase-like cupin family protein
MLLTRTTLPGHKERTCAHWSSSLDELLFTKGKTMELKRAGSQPSVKGPESYFTGSVRIDPLNAPPAPARVSAASVTFEPGARSAWHTHPLGQTLIITAGCGWTQCEGEAKVEIRAGDVIWCPPGHKHWHGATATTSMTHIAVQEALDGVNVVWMDKVKDEDYLSPLGDAEVHSH